MFDRYRSGWQGVCLVAITYVYFLIFAQFAFLSRIASLGIAGSHLKAVMAAMAIGGILFSLLTPRLKLLPSPDFRIRIGFGTCATAAFLTLLPLGIIACMAVSLLTGAGLGLLTVTLVTHLRQWAGDRHPLLNVGVGTGIGYFVCNFPPLFTASPEVQSFTAGLLCVAGIGVTLSRLTTRSEQRTAEEGLDQDGRAEKLPSGAKAQVNLKPSMYGLKPVPFTAATYPQRTFPFIRVLVSFTALVWLDSAAFFIIQNTPELKAGTWEGPIHLWVNGLLHLVAALASVWFLSRRGLSTVLCAAFVALGAACLLLLDPSRASAASVFYPVGVSLYSVALVAYPSLIAPASSVAERGRQAGWIYAIAGWCGSAMGIGMGQNLGYVPPVFVIGAGVAVLLPWVFVLFRQRRREALLVAGTLIGAFILERVLVVGPGSTQVSQIARGRQVYISEGCINCHSQYVRPNSPDVLLWGPVKSMAEVRLERPPLIGNRRQGPDLSEVGGRRSALWLKAHFYNPPEVSGASIMPPYAFLFRDRRGDDLVAYLESLHGTGTEEHQVAERLWHPAFGVVAKADVSEGEHLFRLYCATCHSADGRTRQVWKPGFKRLPPDLALGPFFYLPPSGPVAQRMDHLAEITKFGIPGTDMPGHEYLSDKDIASMSLWLSQLATQPDRKQ